MVDIIDEGFDAVIRSGDLVDSRLTSRQLGSFGGLVVGTPDYFSRYGVPGTPSELSNHRCIHFRNRHTGKLLPWQFARSDDAADPQLPPTVICNTHESQLSFVLEGVGLSYFPDFEVKDEIAKGTKKETKF